MKKIIIAADSFKGTFSSLEAEKIIGAQFKEKFPESEITYLPVADGGEGTTEAFLSFCKGKEIETETVNHLGEKIKGVYALLDDGTAVIEASSACGLYLTEKMEPLKSSTYGVGLIFLDALKRGCKEIIIGIGGTATTDGGCGFIEALGGKFFSEKGEIKNISSGDLCKITSIDLSGIAPKVKNCKITVLCDVKNPLYGEKGAAFVFAPQKGASFEEVKFLDKGLENLGKILDRSAGENVSVFLGAGAAGGLGAGLKFLGAELLRGIDAVLEKSNFKEKAAGADLIITGEGRLDSQTSEGKVPAGVAALRGETLVIAVCGEVTASSEEIKAMGIEKAFSSNPDKLHFEEVKIRRCELLKNAAGKAAEYAGIQGIL